MSLEEKLLQILPKEQIRTNEPMKNHTTFRAGGPADYYVRPTVSQVGPVVKLCREEQIPCQIIGNGSNLLVGDRGIRGLVLEIGAMAADVTVEGNRVIAQAGASLSKVSQAAAKSSLTGMEFASGIPGTVGGAVVMNAGAYGGEIKDILKNVLVVGPDGESRRYAAEELELSYRHSMIPELGGVVLEAVFKLQPGADDVILAKMELLRNQRIQKQPLEYPSAGSTFKRPQGHYAGKLIMDAGLGGFQLGGAQVSEKHCGFVVNKGDATSAEICGLMDEVIRRVQEESGVTLEPEVKKIGEF